MHSIDTIVLVAMAILNGGSFILMYFLINFLTNGKRLSKMGLSAEYIIHTQKHKNKGGIGFILFVFCQILLVTFSLIMGVHVTILIYYYILGISFAIAWGGYSIYYIYWDKKYKDELKNLAIKTQSDIIIDFKYQALGYILNWKLELLTSLLLLYFNVLYLHHSPILYLYIGMPWLIYILLRKMKYQVQATILNAYRIVAFTMIYIQFIKGFLFYMSYFDSKAHNEFHNTADMILFGILTGAMAVTVLFNIITYPKIKKLFSKPLVQESTVAL